MSETIHAKTCSPSGAEGWFACPGRIVMESEFPDQDTDYSSDGTARHHVCADALYSGLPVSNAVGAEITVGADKTVTYKPEWVEEDQDYVDTVRTLAEGGELFVERVVNFEEYTQVKGDSFGTTDAAVLRPITVTGEDVETDAYELIIVDRKTGYVEVSPERNKQLMLYALGALSEFGMVYDIARVRLVIHQRRAREWDCSIDELLAFGKEARSRAASVQNAIQMHGKVDAYKWNATFLNQSPSEDACRYCKAMATCPSMQAKVQELVGADFETVVAKPGDIDGADIPGMLPADNLAKAMASVGLLEDFCKAVRAETERRLLAGQEVPGFGLELGKQGNRKWADEKEAEAALKSMRLTKEQMYDFTVISPTTAEKLAPKYDKDGKLKAAQPEGVVLGDRQWRKLQAHITRSKPVPSVKPISAIKTPYVPPNAADDFAPIPETQEAEAGLELC